MPSLTVLAGPNGVGKTRTTDYFIENGYVPVRPLDLDLLRNEAIDACGYDSYITPQKISKELEKILFSYCHDAIANGRDFSYECNFRDDQLKPIVPFGQAKYEINLVFMLLLSIEQSIERVALRKKEGGNAVDHESIIVNFESGLKNLDDGFNDFQKVIIIDNSIDYKNGKILFVKNYADYIIDEKFPPEPLKPYLPKLTKFCQSTQ
jgi:predicted ABC-type ATPase